MILYSKVLYINNELCMIINYKVYINLDTTTLQDKIMSDREEYKQSLYEQTKQLVVSRQLPIGMLVYTPAYTHIMQCIQLPTPK